MSTQQIDQVAAAARYARLPELLKMANRAVWDAEQEHQRQARELAETIPGDDAVVRRIQAREQLGEPGIVSEWRELREAVAEHFPEPLPNDLHDVDPFDPDPFDTRLRDYAGAVGRGDVQGGPFSVGIARLDVQGFADEYLRAHPRLVELLSIHMPREPELPAPAAAPVLLPAPAEGPLTEAVVGLTSVVGRFAEKIGDPAPAVAAAAPTEAVEAPETDPKLGPVERALALLVKNRTMTVTKIAKIVGCDRATLYRDDRFKLARRALKEARANEAEQSRRRIPRGTKTDGNLEAWET